MKTIIRMLTITLGVTAFAMFFYKYIMLAILLLILSVILNINSMAESHNMKKLVENNEEKYKKRCKLNIIKKKQ